MCRTVGSENLYQGVQHYIARVVHKCHECHRQILPGEPFDKHFCVFDVGRAGSFKICQHCAVLCDWLGTNCDGWIWGEVVEDIEEHARDYKRMDLARLAASANRQWTRFKPAAFPGMPVPKCPRTSWAVLHERQEKDKAKSTLMGAQP